RRQPARHELQRLRRGLVQPLRVVHHADQRLFLGHLAQQGQHRQAQQEAIRRAARLKPERRAQGSLLRDRQPVHPVQVGTAQLVQAGVRELQLRLDAHRPAHPAALGPVDQELEQGGLPDPGLAAQNQNLAMARVDSRHETAQGVAFVLPPPQPAPELARGHALVFHRHPAPDNSSDRPYYGHQGSSELANSPTARPRFSSTPAGVCRPFSNRYLILATFSGRPEVPKKAASPGPNSSSGGSEAQSSSAFVRATDALSNPAIRRANTSTNPVSPASGSTRLTYP